MKATVLFLLYFYSFHAFSQDFELVPYRKGEKWGYSDDSGKIVIPLKYDNAGPFNRGYAVVQLGDSWGILDIRGTYIKTNYDSLGSFFDGYFLQDARTGEQIIRTGIEAYQDGKRWYIDSVGNKLFSSGTPITILEMPKETTNYIGKINIFKENGRYGFEVKVSGRKSYAIYDTLIYSDTDDNYVSQPEPYFIASKRGRWGILTMRDEAILPFEYEYLKERGFRTDILFKRDGKWGVMNRNHKIIIQNEYDSIYYDAEFYFVSRNGKWGVLYHDSKGIISLSYDSISITSDHKGFIVTDSTDKQGYFNTNGQQIIAFEFYNLKKLRYAEGVSYSSSPQNNLRGYLSFDGEIKISPKYREVYPFKNGYAMVITTEGKKGYINESGKEFFK